MKFNWGTGIALAYGLFALGMVGAVFASRKHDPGLMQKNYYELDLNYQARMDKKQNAAALAQAPRAIFNATTGKTISVQFPDGMNVSNGSAKLYRSATTSDDFIVKLENANAFDIPADNLSPGRWHIELDWQADDKPYFWETVVVVQ